MDRLLQEATEWALELRSREVSMERISAWQRWLYADARHAQAFERIETQIDRMGRIRNIPWPTPQEIAADVPQRSYGWRFALAAGIAGVALTGLFIAGYPRNLTLPGIASIQRIETPVGGTQKLILADGSAVDVSGGSALRATFTRRERNITLTQGEAFFRVTRDAARPFIVRAGATRITVLGTAFNVRRAGDRVIVSVAEGTVRVSDGGSTTELREGEQTSAAPALPTLSKVPVEVGSVAGWRDGHLHYLNEPLGSVVMDVGRYTGRDIEIQDAAIANLRITGTVLEHNLDGWLKTLEEAFPVSISKQADGSIVIAAKN